jgi:hypothetical protein
MNLNFDNIDSELKAYLIGLFYADAYLNKRYLELTLSIKDKDYVEKLANIIGVNTHISNKWRYVYKDNGLKKYKLFKTEDEVKNFIKNKIKNYESFTSKMVG